VESNSNQYKRELKVLKDSQEATLKQRDDDISGLRRDLEANRRECADLETKLAESRQMVSEMKRDLQQRTMIVDEANEALTLKDCQIAKLEGRLASLDRLEKMTFLPTSASNNNDNTNASAKPKAGKYQPLSSNGFLEMASSVGVTPLRESPPPLHPSPPPHPPLPSHSLPPSHPSPRVKFDSHIQEKERTPSPRTSSVSRPSLTFSPPRFSPPQFDRLSTSPPIPTSLQPTPSHSFRHPPHPTHPTYPPPHPPFRPSSPPSPTLASSVFRPTTLFSPPAQSAASELDVRFKGVIQYLKENGKCDDELEEIGREMKETLKRSLIDKKALERSTSTPIGDLDETWRRSTLDSTVGTVAMETELNSAEKQLRDLETQLKANAAKRADIDSQLNGFMATKKFH